MLICRETAVSIPGSILDHQSAPCRTPNRASMLSLENPYSYRSSSGGGSKVLDLLRRDYRHHGSLRIIGFLQEIYTVNTLLINNKLLAPGW